MIKKIIDSSLILIYLFSIKIESKVILFNKLISDRKSTKFLEKLKKINIQKSIRIISFLYKTRLFSCLECSIAIKRLMNDDKNVKLNIGFLPKKNTHQFHSWITKSGEIIFGSIRDLNEHKIIIKK